MHILPTAIGKFLCHTGTRSLMRSSAVSNDCPIVRNFADVLIHLIGRHSDRSRQFLIGLSPRLRVARIEKRELLSAV
jgi:hypothetical protein